MEAILQPTAKAYLDMVYANIQSQWASVGKARAEATVTKEIDRFNSLLRQLQAISEQVLNCIGVGPAFHEVTGIMRDIRTIGTYLSHFTQAIIISDNSEMLKAQFSRRGFDYQRDGQM